MELGMCITGKLPYDKQIAGMKFMPLFSGKTVALHIHDNAGLYNQDE